MVVFCSCVIFTISNCKGWNNLRSTAVCFSLVQVIPTANPSMSSFARNVSECAVSENYPDFPSQSVVVSFSTLQVRDRSHLKSSRWSILAVAGSIPVTFQLYLQLQFTSIWGLVCVSAWAKSCRGRRAYTCDTSLSFPVLLFHSYTWTWSFILTSNLQYTQELRNKLIQTVVSYVSDMNCIQFGLVKYLVSINIGLRFFSRQNKSFPDN